MQKVAWGNEIFIKRITNEESKLVSKEYLPTSDGDYLMLIDDTPEASGVRNALTIANFPFDSSNILAKTLAKIRGSDENYIVLTRKVIPIGTGLGGGSSDAAVLINCLNGAVNSEEIVKIGSDVPFLAHNCNAAIVSGIGDKIHEIELNGYNDWVYILIPQELVSTKDIFCKARELLSSGKFHKNTRLFERNLEFVKGFNSLASGDDLESSETLGNDMEGCIINGNVLKLHNLLKNLLHGKCFGMSGSGSSFFVLGTNDDVMKQIRHTYGSPLIIVKTRFKSEGNNHVFEYL
ncbi:4-diphosphocytidyl-2-C-methyl-D-erythritol kinase, putative [Theileria equi strain WA]|uniref:4-diphosphocytidyl-2-C-methyl-D-erythritol kinase, putative n=1 Tax=Theileria equi strain WA TaxID=1537102 RepID=L0AWI8_THEEQ|nr:4-diphosphocytidyl-2-C-methyl-D-erythritol kinase, putative [Theileria equi strain WA]AFZ79623.1 4-diphosphocytidyl-2-C-methyl-D-erythritol kinase, putative [Theileria equi strain WA]|eukprot:XP_004829289.1 4-diphosphocytidyl-2-C-methyl-D-erythritol kinase, putative [Theileria equi strain WA]